MDRFGVASIAVTLRVWIKLGILAVNLGSKGLAGLGGQRTRTRVSLNRRVIG